jgi:hypothetical protein
MYSVCWGGNKWPRRPLGVNYSAEAVWRFAWWFFCWRGSWTACQSALGGDGVNGHHYWWPCGLSWILGFGGFFSKEKNLGEQKFARLLASNFRSRVQELRWHQRKMSPILKWLLSKKVKNIQSYLATCFQIEPYVSALQVATQHWAKRHLSWRLICSIQLDVLVIQSLLILNIDMM